MVVAETQKFAPWILCLMRGLVIFLVILSMWVFTRDTLAGIGFTFIVVICVLPMLSLEVMRLRTEYNGDGISLNFIPFVKRHYNWFDIEKAELINYGFVGGWGIRMGTQYGTVYNTQGAEGLLLTLKTGRQITIGTQKPNAISEVVNHYLHKARS